MTRVCAAATPLVGSLGRGRRAAPPRAGRRPRARCARAAPLAAPPFAQSALLFASRRALYQHCCPFAPLALNTPPRSFNYPTPPFVHARRRPAAGRGRGAPGSTPGGRPARFSQSGRPGGPSTPPHRVSAPPRSPTVQCLVSLSLSPSALLPPLHTIQWRACAFVGGPFAGGRPNADGLPRCPARSALFLLFWPPYVSPPLSATIGAADSTNRPPLPTKKRSPPSLATKPPSALMRPPTRPTLAPYQHYIRQQKNHPTQTTDRPARSPPATPPPPPARRAPRPPCDGGPRARGTAEGARGEEGGGLSVQRCGSAPPPRARSPPP